MRVQTDSLLPKLPQHAFYKSRQRELDGGRKIGSGLEGLTFYSVDDQLSRQLVQGAGEFDGLDQTERVS